MAAPQSACMSIRRKSTAFDHFNSTAPSTVTTTPLSTPERPLLMEFRSNQASPERASSAQQHIYVEVEDNKSEMNFQPIHYPLVNTNNHQPQRLVNFPNIQQREMRKPESLSLTQVNVLQQQPVKHRGMPVGVQVSHQDHLHPGKSNAMVESSNSSQSSGYYSSPTTQRALKFSVMETALPNQSFQSSPIKTISLMSASTQQQQQFSPKMSALEIQDSQFI